MGKNGVKQELTVEQSFGVIVQAIDKAAKEGAFGIKDASVVNEAVETLQEFLQKEVGKPESDKAPAKK